MKLAFIQLSRAVSQGEVGRLQLVILYHVSLTSQSLPDHCKTVFHLSIPRHECSFLGSSSCTLLASCNGGVRDIIGKLDFTSLTSAVGKLNPLLLELENDGVLWGHVVSEDLEESSIASSAIGRGILESSWKVGGEVSPLLAALLLASHVPAASWLIGVVLSSLNGAVLLLSDLVLLGWDFVINVDNGVVDRWLSPVAFLLPAQFLHSVIVLAESVDWVLVGFSLGNNPSVSFAGSDDGVAQVVLKWNIGGSDIDTTVGQLDPSGSDTRSLLSGNHGILSLVGNVNFIDILNTFSESLVDSDGARAHNERSDSKSSFHNNYTNDL